MKILDLPFKFVLSMDDDTAILSYKDVVSRFPNVASLADQAILHKVFGEQKELRNVLFKIGFIIGSYIDGFLFDGEDLSAEDGVDYKELYAYMEQDDQAILDFINRKYGKENIMSEKEMREEIKRLKEENELLKENNELLKEEVRKLKVILYEC